MHLGDTDIETTVLNGCLWCLYTQGSANWSRTAVRRMGPAGSWDLQPPGMWRMAPGSAPGEGPNIGLKFLCSAASAFPSRRWKGVLPTWT
jgi:hypothetical protein